MTEIRNPYFSAPALPRVQPCAPRVPAKQTGFGSSGEDAIQTIITGLLGAIVVWHFYGGLITYLLGLPDYVRLGSYAAFLILTPYAFYRRSNVDAYEFLIIALTAFVWVRSSQLIRESEGYDLLMLYLAGFCMPSLVIARLWPARSQKLGISILFVGMTAGETLATLYRISTDTGRAVFEFDAASNPVGLSVSTISAVTIAIAFALNLWHTAHRGLLWLRVLSVTVFAFAGYMLVKALDLGTRSLLFALALASCVMIAHQARSAVKVLSIVVVGALAIVGVITLLFEDWGPPQRFVEFFHLIGDANDDWSVVLRWGDAAIVERFYWWRAYLDCFAERPLFGCGLRMGAVESGIPYAHNIFIGAAGEFGIAGLALLVAFVVLVVRDMRRIWPQKDPVATAALGLVIAGFVQLQFSLDLPIAKHFVVGAALLRSVAANAGKVKGR